jgi:hypothetical protein
VPRGLSNPSAADFTARARRGRRRQGRRPQALRNFVEAADVKVDWKGIDEAPNEALVNALCMMSPFGPREKQALLEAPDLKSRGRGADRHHRNRARPRRLGTDPAMRMVP